MVRKPFQRLTRLAAAGLVLAGALSVAPNARAVVPLPTYPECGKDGTVSQCPPDLTSNDGGLQGDAWPYLNFIPDFLQNKVRKQELEMGSGSWTTVAWQTTTGRWDVKIAVLDCGIRWNKWSLVNKVALNTAELPPPQRADGSVCADYDCDGNGLTNIQDYANDSRVHPEDGVDDAAGMLDGSDLIATFSDGIDDDGDGYVDNIAGWDFFWDNNDPYTTNDFYHGSSVMEDAAGEGGEQDSVIGHCPNCSVLPVRISDSFVGEGDKIAAGIVYAVDHGAQVIGMALGSLSNPEYLQEAMQYAWDRNVTIVAAAGDELGFHHNYPGANDYALYVHSIKYYPIASLETARTLLGYYGCNNFGSRLDGVAASGGCATGSVAATTGMAGLVYSRARDLDIDLSPAEVRALLLGNTDDINVAESRRAKSKYFPSREGWEQYFGHGRINAGKAVGALNEGIIPPEVYIEAPSWFEYVDPRFQTSIDIRGGVNAKRSDRFSYAVEWAPGADPADTDFIPISGKSNLNEAVTGVLATFDFNDIDPTVLDAAAPVEVLEGTDTVQGKTEKLNARSITIRVRAMDANGVEAQERKQFFLIEDADLLSGFPVRLGHSGESSPVLFDLNEDGKMEILLATSNGDVHAYTSNGKELVGWPVKTNLLTGLDPANPNNHLDGEAYATGGVNDDVHQGMVATVAAGDLENDGVAEVVVATLEGYLYVYTADGKLKSGFPVRRDPVSDADTSPYIWRDPGMFSTPALYDLDADGKLEIIQASMDQKVYVWRYDGKKQSGFPVLLENPDGSTGETTKTGRIVSSPAIGDLDGDGKPEIVVGSNEYDAEKTWIGYVYALNGDGNNNPLGPVVGGWPAEVKSLLSGVIMYIGEGIPASPALADVDADGQLEVFFSGVLGRPVFLRHDGSLYREMGCAKSDFGSGTNSAETTFWSVVSNPALADFDQDGNVDAMLGGSGLQFFLALGLSEYRKWDHLATVWNPRTGKMFDAFPRVTEDITLLSGVSAGDVGGDGNPEMIIGTSGYVLHAFQQDGMQPDGWPKFTGGWLIGTPAVGDIDGDGKNEVVAMTREGYLFAWNTNGMGGLEWSSFRHDPQNTGNYEVTADYRANRAMARTAHAGGGEVTIGASSGTGSTLQWAASCSVSPRASGNSGLAGLVGLLSLGMMSLSRRRR